MGQPLLGKSDRRSGRIWLCCAACGTCADSSDVYRRGAAEHHRVLSQSHTMAELREYCTTWVGNGTPVSAAHISNTTVLGETTRCEWGRASSSGGWSQRRARDKPGWCVGSDIWIGCDRPGAGGFSPDNGAVI